MDLAGGQCMGHRPTQIIGQRRGADRTVISPWNMTTSAWILHLRQQAAVFTLDRVGPTRQIVHHAVVPCTDTVAPLMRSDNHRLRHHHCGATFRAVGIVVDLALLDTVLGAEMWRDRSMHNTVPKRLSSKLKG